MSHLFTSSGSGSEAGVGEGKAGCPEEGEPLRTPSPMAAIDPIFVLEPWETAMDFFFREVVVQRGEKMRRGAALVPLFKSRKSWTKSRISLGLNQEIFNHAFSKLPKLESYQNWARDSPGRGLAGRPRGV